MKKLILALFIIFGTLSFSAFDKVVIGVINDNYESPIISGTINRGGLANLLFGMKKDGDFAKQMYQNLSGADKVEFIIEKHDESALVSILKLFEKNKYKGQVEVTEVAASENKNIRQITTKNGWNYNIYTFTREIPGTIKISDNDINKGEFIEDLFQKAKKELK
ncbi:hypothetical protein [Leptotrichia sp. oral taxon 879]|uniref:hypothetical protein n=1 Tax=Leptotrichia sp. oral taxon 879 TaxID=1227267 RepID=UPI0003ADD3DB|nr:hypothetical protein [Leptotrichia sp. oral taxon 879]ERK55069.1 hypothetical protein HMPREF1552_00292 [Leptotrichia sp. oral taxon 879 str. F0557]